MIIAVGVAAGNTSGQDQSTMVHMGMCDASAAVALDGIHFAVANDEDNILRIYRNDRAGLPRVAMDYSWFLKPKDKHPETDIEGATWLGDRIYFITSHGRNKDGKFRESRHRLFAMKVETTEEGGFLRPDGLPYRGLMSDLLRNRDLKQFDLLKASQLAPKAEGGFNIESLCSTPQNHLLIGFRNPIPRGKALVVRLINPEGILGGESAVFGESVLLDLGGNGIRDMIRLDSDYIIIAGSYDGLGVSQLWRWEGGVKPPVRVTRSLADFNPEALMVVPGRPNELLVLSDDGTREINGQDCKMLSDAGQRRFRSRWIRWGEIRRE